ncbi:hypothetical protein QN277_027171 [Acacia crassicarpa]|uniref:Uncharacterized protein n=1 Tax=Acacia crassicarpa TaxID=499986 RepID=A0AAE1MMP1_9FABA|nr:hypothetical protein QN277_027171 [Acacia crassicarpa]
MYPKVKVRQEQYQEDHRAIQDNNLKALPSLSLRISPPPVRNQKGVSHPSPAEAPKCYVFHTPKPRVPVSEDLGACNLAADSSGLTGHEKDDNIDEDRVNIRASSVPPPRAVISSPDNDTMIGNKNRIKGRERLSGSKNYGVLQNRHAQCKVKSSNVTENSPNMRKPKEAADKSSNATDSAQKSRRPTKSSSNQITHPKKWDF